MIQTIYNNTAVKKADWSTKCVLTPSYPNGINLIGNLSSEFKFGMEGEWIPGIEVGEPTGLIGTLFALGKLEAGINVKNTGGAPSAKIFNGGKYTTIPISMRIYGAKALVAVDLFTQSCLPSNEIGTVFLEKMLTYFMSIIKGIINEAVTNQPQVALFNLLAGQLGLPKIEVFSGAKSRADLTKIIALQAIPAIAERLTVGGSGNEMLTAVSDFASTVYSMKMMLELAKSANPGQMIWNVQVGDLVNVNNMCLDNVDFSFSNQRTAENVPLYVDFNLSFSTRTIPTANTIGSNNFKFIARKQ